VKVADFGIARATNASTVTTNDEGILGSVHYFSPEQAKGEVADEKSDIYSLGVVIYEMATGSLPFDGDQPVTIALKHIQQLPISPKELNPDIPNALNEVVLKALRKNRHSRYKSAIAMELDLSMVLSHPDGGYIVGPKDYTKEEEGSLALSSAPQKGKGKKVAADDAEHTRSLVGKRGGIILLTAGTILAVLIILLMAVWFWKNVILSPINVDSTVGMTMEEAVELLDDKGYQSLLVPVYSDSVPRDFVITQNVQTVNDGLRVILEISNGPEFPVVADLKGLTIEQAQKVLYDQGLSLGDVVNSTTTDNYEEGQIFMHSPASGEKAKNGDKVVVFVNTPLAEKEVPKVLGMAVDAAEAALENEGFKLGTVTPIDASDVPDGTFISQTPDYGEIALEGSFVDVTVAASAAYEPQHVEFTLDIPSGGATVILYYNIGNDSKELLREVCPAEKKLIRSILNRRPGKARS
jgi:serine/threonine-protein kinase